MSRKQSTRGYYRTASLLVVVPLALAISPQLASATTSTSTANPSGDAGAEQSAVSYFPLPPANFNPLTASAIDLAEYGFPARPTDPSQLATWEHAMSHFKQMLRSNYGHSQFKTHPAIGHKTASTQTSNGSISSYQNGTWGGYLDYNTTSYKFDAAQGEFVTKPIAATSQSYGSHYSAWVGIGGFSYQNGHQSPYVLQAGVAVQQSSTSTTDSFTPFWEIGGYNYQQPITNLAVHSNDTMYVDITYNASAYPQSGYVPGVFSWFVEDESTGYSVSGSYQYSAQPYYDGSEAEAITEANQVGGSIDCGDFETLPWSGTYVNVDNSSNTGYALGDTSNPFSIDYLYAYNQNDYHYIIQPGGFTSSSSFPTTWYNYN